VTEASSARSPRPRTSREVLEARLDDETVLYDPRRQELFVLNSSAALVWSCCDGSATPAEIAADIAEVFQADPATVEQQVAQLVEDWRGRGLLDDPEA
jgi:PqqD family protein of HPr-rel-A system